MANPIKELIEELKELERFNGKTINVTERIDLAKLREMIAKEQRKEIRRRTTY